MTDLVLKSTECGQFCGFSKITSYCLDCPTLLCNKCKIAMHKSPQNKNHVLIDFDNVDLNWSDKNAMKMIFEDQNLFERVFTVISKKNQIPKIDEAQSEADCWTCHVCTYIYNSKKLIKCQMCCSVKQFEHKDEDYDRKLEKYQEEMYHHLVSLDEIHMINTDIPFENIVFCYKIAQPEISISDWYHQYYPNRRSFDIINQIILDKSHEIRINELDRQYNEIIKNKNTEFLNCIMNEDISELLINENELIEPATINKRNIFPNHMLNKTVDENQIRQIVFKEDSYSEREKRILMTELVLDSDSKIEVLKTYLNDSELRTYLTNSLNENTMTLNHIRQAVNDGFSISVAWNFLRKECELCCMEYPMPEMLDFLTCKHEFCKTCMLKWLEETIQTKYPCKWNCPNCDEKNYNSIDKNLYYSHLRRILVDEKILLTIFEEKLLKDRLMKSELFHWCANETCENGFEAEGVNKIQCPSCHQFMCVECNRSWTANHEDKTCEEFEMWMLRNDPNLSKLLRNIGIECPDCGMRYALAAGGCLHFDCKACGAKFCGGCYEKFVDKCDKPTCEMNSFHGHHPRNCLYFLRDYDSNFLENMLKDTDYPKLQGKPETTCQYMITTDKLRDVPCNAEVHGTSGMCDKHYREYLVQFINRLKIDPADFVDDNSLNLMLFQMVLPRLTKAKGETDVQFKERLKKTVKEKCLFYIPKGIN